MGQSNLTVLDVAKYILTKVGKPMSTMKLQKLTYYCQAWRYTWTQKPLFSEPFEAWANGPVCRALYEQHRGKFFIDAATFQAGAPQKLSESERVTVDDVLDAYLTLSGLQLSELTHSEDPWLNARGTLPPKSRAETVIELDAMRKYYSALDDDPEAQLVTDMERPAWA